MPPIPDDELISAYLDDELSREERLRAEQLLLDRADLRRLFEELRGLRDGLRSLPKFSLGEEFSSMVLRKAERSVLQSGANPEEAARVDLPVAEPIAAAADASPVPPVAASSSTAAESVPTTQAAPIQGPAPFQTVPPVMPAGTQDRSRIVRPVIWSLTAVAAALALMIYQQGRFSNHDTALNHAPATSAEGPSAPAATTMSPRPTSDDSAGKALNETMTTAGDAKKSNNKARYSDGPAVADSVALGSSSSTNTVMAPAPQPAPTTIVPPGGLFAIQNGAAAGAVAGITTKTGAGTLRLAGDNSYSGATGATISNGDIRSDVDADSLEGIVIQDRERGELLAWNFLKLQSDHPDVPIDAGQLQKLATLDQLGRANNLGFNSLAGNTVDAQRRKQADNYGYGTAAAVPAPAGAGSNAGGAGIAGGMGGGGGPASTLTLNGNNGIALGGAAGNVGIAGHNFTNGSFASYGDNNLLVVMCEVTPEALDNFTPLLRGNQIADYSAGANVEAERLATGRASMQADGRNLTKSQATEQGAVLPMGAAQAQDGGSSKAGPSVPGARPGDRDVANRDVADGGRGMNSAGSQTNGGTLVGAFGGDPRGGAVRGNNQTEDKSSQAAPAAKAEAGAFAGGNKNGDGKEEADKSANARYFATKNLGDLNGNDVEFFYVVANREQLEETLKTLREEPQYFLNVNVEPATPEVAESARWRGYNRGGAMVDGPKTDVSKTIPVAKAAAPYSAPAMPAAAPAIVAAKPTGTVPAVNSPAGANAPATTQSIDLTASLPTGQPVPTPIGQQKVAADNVGQAYESQLQQQQRRSFSLSRVQRFNVEQIESGRLNYAGEQNLAAEKAKAFYAADPTTRQAGAPQQGTPRPSATTTDVAKKVDSQKPADGATNEPRAQPRRENPTKEAAPSAMAAAAPTAAAVPAPGSASGMKPAEAKPNGLNPGNPMPAETQNLAKDEGDLRSRQAKLGVAVDNRNGVVGGAPQSNAAPAGDSPTITAPASSAPMVAMQQAEPEQVLGKIVGAQQPPPIVQQPMPPLQQNRIRGTAIAEPSQQDALQQAPQQQVQQVELPPGYHEALFIFRVVKRAPNGSAPKGESDSTTKPTGK